MITIWKYPFATADVLALGMPVGAEILSVQVQDGTPCLWAKVETSRPAEERVFRVYGTGHPIDPPDGRPLDFVGTYQSGGGSLVFHLFEESTP